MYLLTIEARIAMSRRNPGRSLCATFVVGLSLAAGAPQLAAEESPCKGLEESACEAKDACRWVEGYTRKDGVKVSSHCRKGAKSKGAASSGDKDAG